MAEQSEESKTCNEENQKSSVGATKLGELVKGCYDENEKIQEECCRQLRKLTSQAEQRASNSASNEIAKTGIIPRLVQLLHLSSSSTKLQFETCWILTNIVYAADETSGSVQEMVNQDAVRYLNDLVLCSDDEVAVQAVWVLSNIAGHSWKCRDIVLEAGVVSNIIALQRRQTIMRIPNNLDTLSYCLHHFCGGDKDNRPSDCYMKQCIEPLSKLLCRCQYAEYDKYDIAWHASSSICNIIKYHHDHHLMHEMKRCGLLKYMVSCLGHKQLKVKKQVLRELANLTSGSDQDTENVLHAGILNKSVHICEDYKRLHNTIF